MTISINHESFAAKTVKTTLFLVVSRCLYGPLLKRKAEFCSDLLKWFALWIYCLLAKHKLCHGKFTNYGNHARVTTSQYGLMKECDHKKSLKDEAP